MRRNHEANSSARWAKLRDLPRALKGRPVPNVAQGAGVEHPRDAGTLGMVREQSMSPERTVLGGSRKAATRIRRHGNRPESGRAKPQDRSALRTELGWRERPFRTFSLFYRRPRVASILASLVSTPPWAGSRGPPLRGSWERPLHNARASLPTPPKRRRPRRGLSPSPRHQKGRRPRKKTVPFSTSRDGSRRSHEAESRSQLIGTMGQAEGVFPEP